MLQSLEIQSSTLPSPTTSICDPARILQRMLFGREVDSQSDMRSHEEPLSIRPIRSGFLHSRDEFADNHLAESDDARQSWGKFTFIFRSQILYNFLVYFQVSPSRAAKYVPRYYAMAQEGSLLGAHGLLCRSPQPSRQFVYELLQHDPTVIDLVLKCAVIPRPAWYPETQVDSTACELLVMLFDFPLNVVPGIPIPYDRSDWTEEINTELAVMVKSLKMLTSRSGWVEELLSIWGKIDSEKWPKVQK